MPRAAPTYTGPVNDSINNTPQGDALVRSNQARMAALGVAIPGVGGAPAASEPAVISSTSIDEHIADTKNKLATFAKKGTTVGADGNSYYADNSLVPAPQDATYNDTTGQYEYNGKKYGVAEFYQDDPSGDYAAIQKLFAPLKAGLDAGTLATVNDIHSQFDALRAEQEQFNKNAEQSRSRALLLGGASHYAPLAASSTMTAQVSYGLKKIQDLDEQENAAIAKAHQAQQDGDMRLMSDTYSMADGIRKEKQAEAQKVADQLRTANQKVREQNLQASRDSAIADLVAQGVTDPAQMLNYLNFHEDGTQVGDFTADEVSKVMKALTVDGKKENLPQDLETFNYLRDNIGLPDEIAKLPPAEQYFAYLAALKGASNAGDFTLGTNQVRYDAHGKVLARGPAGKIKPGSSDKNSDSSDPANKPSFEAYLDAATKLMGVPRYLASRDVVENIRKQYDSEFGNHPQKLTPAELKKLEAAGLLNAPRPEQLKYLYDKKKGTPDTSSNDTNDLPPSLR